MADRSTGPHHSTCRSGECGSRAEGHDVIGGAAVACDNPSVQMLGRRRELAVLWDIRVRETSRRHGVGAALFREAARWAKSKGYKLLEIETQNVNVAACRFYAAMGCMLGRIDSLAYVQSPELADEIMLVWSLDLVNWMDSAGTAIYTAIDCG